VATRQHPSGSVLTAEDAASGLNFLSAAAFAAYHLRRSEGWGVDPDQATRHMVSSQALMFNLFAPLAANPPWFAQTLRLALGRSDIQSVRRTSYEVAPARRSQYLGDMTRIDVLLELSTNDGSEIVAVELKLADRFNSRVVDVRERAAYRQLADVSGAWLDAAAALSGTKTNQLLRMHALALAMRNRDHGAGTKVTCLVLHHERDLAAVSMVGTYKSLVMEQENIVACGLAVFVDAMVSAAPGRSNKEDALALRARYTDESGSESLWEAYRRSGNRGIRRTGQG